jgi:hypothetical protein
MSYEQRQKFYLCSCSKVGQVSQSWQSLVHCRKQLRITSNNLPLDHVDICGRVSIATDFLALTSSNQFCRDEITLWTVLQVYIRLRWVWLLFLPLLSLLQPRVPRHLLVQAFLYGGPLLLPLAPCLKMPLGIVHFNWVALQTQAEMGWPYPPVGKGIVPVLN